MWVLQRPGFSAFDAIRPNAAISELKLQRLGQVQVGVQLRKHTMGKSPDIRVGRGGLIFILEFRKIPKMVFDGCPGKFAIEFDAGETGQIRRGWIGFTGIGKSNALQSRQSFDLGVGQRVIVENPLSVDLDIVAASFDT